MLLTILKYLNFIPGLVSLLTSWGVPTGTLGAEAVKLVEATDADITNYEAGQAVVVANISVENEAGYLVAMKVGGPAAASLGL
jgi:hypothetical protein